MRKRIRAITVIIVMIAVLYGSILPGFAFSENESRSVENFFTQSQLLKGNGNGYGLDQPPTRMEGIIILIRLLGKDTEAQQLQSLPCRFADVPDWAAGYANYAYDEAISRGVSDTRFGTNDLMTAQQFHALLLRVIGYDDRLGDFQWDHAVEQSVSLDILPGDLAERYEDTPQYQYTKRDLIQTAFCFLQAQYKDGAGTLIGKLISSGVISEDLAEEYGLVADNGWDSISTNLSGDEFYHFELDDNHLAVTGSSGQNNREWLLVLISNRATGAEKLKKVGRRNSSGEYDFTLTLDNLPKGDYYVDLYSNDEKYNSYTSFILSSLVLRVAENDSYFVPSPAYGENLRFYKGNEVERRDESLTLLTRADKDTMERVKMLSAEITKDCKTDYDKILAIHDWVAGNIYYDKDYINGKTKITNLASQSVLDSRYTVCQGYSVLTKDLITAAGIPCKIVAGYALLSSNGADAWEDFNKKGLEPNHAWNEACADGRWVILDTTWDSSNEYEGGKFIKGGMVSRLFFDSTVNYFSNTHKTMDYILQ